MTGLISIGIDANPICVDISRAKTEWKLNLDNLRKAATGIRHLAESEYTRLSLTMPDTDYLSSNLIANEIFQRSDVGRYLVSSGLIHRGWISPIPAIKTLLVAEGIWQLRRSE